MLCPALELTGTPRQGCARTLARAQSLRRTATTSSHKQPVKEGPSNHKQSQPTTSSHMQPRAVISSHKQPQATTSNHKQPQTTTSSHKQSVKEALMIHKQLVCVCTYARPPLRDRAVEPRDLVGVELLRHPPAPAVELEQLQHRQLRLGGSVREDIDHVH